MATPNSRDVSLVIKARDEATSAIQSVTDSLNKLFAGQKNVEGSAKSTGTSLAEMAAVMASVDKAVAGISGTADRAEQAFNRMSAAIEGRKRDLAAFKQQAEEAQRAIAVLSSPAAVVGAGRDQGPRIAQVRELQTVYDSLQKKIAALGSTIADEEQKMQASQSSLQQLGSSAISAAEQQQKLTDAYNRRREAVEALAAKEQQAAQARTNLEALNARISPTLAGQTAAVGGATTGALVAREEAAAVREAAQAFQMFEAVARQKMGAFNAIKAEQTKEQRAAAGAAQQEAEALAQLMRELNPLVALQDKFAAKLELARKAMQQGKISAEQFAAAEKQLANEMKRAEADVARNGRQGVALFGLRPYELTNFGYQINDVVTQLASGTSLMQTMAQQGGQILQLFPRVGSALVTALTNPVLLAGVATVGLFALAVRRAADESQRLRDIQAKLDLSASGGNYNAQAINGTVLAMRQLGAASEDATKAVNTFLEQGLQQSRFQQFGRLAVETARVIGVDVPDAAQQLAQAFTGGYEAVAMFDDKLNFLTTTQREHIRTLFEQGRAEDARKYALDIFAAKMDEVAGKQQGEWAKATRALSSAWQSFIGWLSNSSVIQETTKALADLGNAVSEVLNRWQGLGTVGETTAAKLANARADLAESQRKLAIVEKAIPFLGADAASVELGNALRIRIANLQSTIKALEAETRGNGGVTDQGENSAAAKRRGDLLHNLSLEEELQKLRDKATTGLTQQEKARREELAGMIAIRGESDRQVQAALRRVAVEKEHTAILKEQKTLTEKTDADRERAISQFSSRVVGAEGGTARNPNSSAVGFGQFVDATWLEQFKKVFAAEAKGLSDQQILALRNNERIARGIIDNYARENAAFLKSFGAEITAGNLYLAHFLGAGGAKKILDAPGDTPVNKLLSKEAVAANKGYLFDSGAKRYRTADELEKFIAGRIGDTGAAQSSAQAEIAKLQENAIERQDKFNRAVEKGNEERQRSIEALTVENQLQDTALLAAERKAAVDKAEFDLKQRVADINAGLGADEAKIELTQAQIDKTRELAAAEFDLQNARAQAQAQTNEVQRPVTDFAAERDALQARIDYLNENGLLGQAQALQPELEAVNEKLREAIDNAIAFYEALNPADDPLHRTQEQIDGIILGLKTQKDEAQNWVNVMGVGGKQIAEIFSTGAVSALDRFARAVAEGGNAFKALWSSFRQFAADFLQQIVKMIQQAIVFKLVSGIVSSVAGGGGGGAWIQNIPGSTVAHTGGVIGRDVMQTRAVNPAWFLNAARYHIGGIAGLRPDEQAAILQKNEEVLTTSDPRHRWNGGGQKKADPLSVKVVNAFDAADMLSKALETKAGQRTILNFLGANNRSVGQAMGG